MAITADRVIQTRINGKVKDEAATVLAAIGLTVSDAVRLMLTRIAQDKALPFDPLVPNATTIAAMQAARAGELEPVTLDQIKAEIQAAQAE
jgi:DNA-damage-inducible protein J